jgi:hypothetical protein
MYVNLLLTLMEKNNHIKKDILFDIRLNSSFTRSKVQLSKINILNIESYGRWKLVKNGTNVKIPDNTNYVDGPNSFIGELHYFFGVGFKTGKRLIVMPMIETPILALLPFNHIKSTHSYLNTRARPFLLRVRFMFLEKGSKSCPKVSNPMGIDPNGNLNQ